MGESPDAAGVKYGKLSLAIGNSAAKIRVSHIPAGVCKHGGEGLYTHFVARFITPRQVWSILILPG
ncbi:hypothetical protein BV22DRAFT_1037893 [Leucogyrophana mollusca]|uniref:Uncharacterized protein n=1 Tax=Leucogyrophana mollusca TaxID=85980 RepID=A0ACB8BA31_9AGAM|nr:hypothetical protein BV22DRAFT_1037893 [Leucogyrophana mollusca]